MTSALNVKSYPFWGFKSFKHTRTNDFAKILTSIHHACLIYSLLRSKNKPLFLNFVIQVCSISHTYVNNISHFGLSIVKNFKFFIIFDQNLE